MILENTEAFPRAWVVHRAEFIPPIRYQSKQERRVPMERLLYRSLDLGMKLWQGRDYGDYPLQSQVMLEYTGTQDLRKYQSGGPPLDSETVRFNSYTPTSVEMTVKLESPGFLVLADTYHRGWTATVDGQPAELIRANRAMRAVPVPAGEHVVVMRYFSMPFAVGAALSLCGWGFAAAAACLGAASRLRSTSA